MLFENLTCTLSLRNIYFGFLFPKTRQHLRFNLLFGPKGHFGLLKDINISFFLHSFLCTSPILSLLSLLHVHHYTQQVPKQTSAAMFYLHLSYLISCSTAGTKINLWSPFNWYKIAKNERVLLLTLFPKHFKLLWKISSWEQVQNGRNPSNTSCFQENSITIVYADLIQICPT